MAYELDAWSDFFVASAGATAALTGLVFVAVSINLERILSIAGLPDRALSTLVLLLGALVVAAWMRPISLTWIAIASAALSASSAPTTPSSWPGARLNTAHLHGIIAIAFMGTVPFLVGGLSLAEGSGGGLYWVMAGTIAAIVGAVANAWVLLVEVLR